MSAAALWGSKKSYRGKILGMIDALIAKVHCPALASIESDLQQLRAAVENLDLPMHEFYNARLREWQSQRVQEMTDE